MGELKFAVMREDPELELALCDRLRAERVLIVASGGCTALELAARGFAVTAFDVNPAQLAHLGAKRDAIARGDVRALNVEDSDPGGLNQCGAFESLFRVFRSAVTEFVVPADRLEAWFDPATTDAARGTAMDAWSRSPYWPAAFVAAFNDTMLEAMFGEAATQHAARGSYPEYFRRVFERGLRACGAAANPFLQHVLLGRYRAADAPAYTRAARQLVVELVHGTLLDVERLDEFQLYSLSNIFDWSGDALVAAWAARLGGDARSGSAVLLRQLNNQRDLRRFFEPAFVFDDELGRSLAARDRSLFYERVEVGLRR